ncbi:MAG: ROK family protein [Clostridia bacterium]|nr:ROK family protein [Clostridia bacterium]
MSYYIGIDVGGMTVKGAVIDGSGALIAEGNVPTVLGDVAQNAASLVTMLTEKAGGVKIDGIGIGCAGMIDSEAGTVVFAGNLDLKEYPLAERVQRETGLPVKITNDANAAALGEAKFGAGKHYKDSIFVTLGTGVGGGIVIGGKLYEGYKSAGAEIGHMVIERGGDLCTCGRRGCFEAYSSATALIRRTKWAMEEDAGSKMWTSCTSQTVTGKTAFDFADCDYSAKQVVDWYIDRLACGLVNLANIFRPQVIMLGGGVSNEGERLLTPLKQKFERHLFGGTAHAPVALKIASLGSRAGVYGAAALFIED